MELDARPSSVSTAVILIALLVPWTMFVACTWLLSFSVHYASPHWAWVGCLVCFGIPVILLLVGGRAKVVGKSPVPWYFSAGSSVVAILFGATLGDMNYWFNAQPFYDIGTMNAYWDVNPSVHAGRQHMDAGRVHFADGVRIDESKAMGFKNVDTYCVAPIVAQAANVSRANPLSDWWAVGLNCCASGASFTCGDVGNPKARAGLRAMRDEQRPFFRLAVRQAQGQYGIAAPHPLFFYWMEDPSQEILGYRDRGMDLFVKSSFAFFVLNSVLVVIVVTGIAQLMPVKRRIAMWLESGVTS